MSEEVPDQIEKSVLINAPVSRVWRALTNHVEFGEWFRVRLDQPFVAGGVSTGAMTYPGCEGLEWKAVIERIEPQTLFTFRWQPDSHLVGKDAEEVWTLVTFYLEPVPPHRHGIRVQQAAAEPPFQLLPGQHGRLGNPDRKHRPVCHRKPVTSGPGSSPRSAIRPGLNWWTPWRADCRAPSASFPRGPA